MQACDHDNSTCLDISHQDLLPPIPLEVEREMPSLHTQRIVSSRGISSLVKQHYSEMKKLLIGLFCSFLPSTITYADKQPLPAILTAVKEQTRPKTDANVFGHVVEKKTGKHLPYILVCVKGTTFATTTDDTGHYLLPNLPEGTWTIQAKAMGYKTVEKQISAKAHTNTNLDFEIEEDNIALNEVVVSANRKDKQSRLSPNLVSVLTSKVFENTQAACLTEGLNFQPGVRVEDNCQNCGFSQVRINGLDGHYSQILIDSRPTFSALAGVYGLEQIPASMISQVEVVRGGGSALFGGAAIGGTINIITKDPIRNSAELSHSLMSIGGKNAFDNNTMLNASLVTSDRRAGLYLYGQSRYRQGYDRDEDGFTEIPNFRNQVIGIRSFFNPDAYSKITLEYHSINDFRRGGDHQDRPPHESQITEQIEHAIYGGGVTYDLYSPNSKNHLSTYYSFQQIARKSYYGGTGKYDYALKDSYTGEEAQHAQESFVAANKAYGRTHDLTMVVGTQYIHTFDELLFMPSDLTLGAEYNTDNIKDIISGYDRDFRQRTRTASTFMQNEWKDEQWSFLIGGRFDKHNMIHHIIFSPRINLRYNPTRNINFRLSWAGGFRAPQAFDEDLHVEMVGGERVTTILAKDLREERSNSLSASADLYHTHGSLQANLLIEGFYTDINHIFALRLLDNKDNGGNRMQERYNGTGAKVYGLNLESKIAYRKLIDLQLGFTLQKSLYDEAETWNNDAPAEKTMLRTPNAYGYFTLNINPAKRLSVSLSGTYTGSMLVGHNAGSGVLTPVAINTPTFFSSNVKVSYDIPVYQGISLQVNAGVQNFTDAYQKDFDKGWNRDSNYIYGPSLPRSYFIGCKLSL